MFGEVISSGPKAINAHTVTFAPIFESLLPPIIVDTAYKAPPIFQPLAKFHGDRSRQLVDIALQSAR